MTFTDQAPGILPHTQLRAADARKSSSPVLHREGTGRRVPIDTRTAVDVRTGTVVPVLDVTIPAYNEEQDLEQSLRRLHAYLHGTFPHSFRITVADNASTDGTLRVAERVARELREVTVVRLPDAGRGKALRTVWLASPSPVLAYMDVNLSTDLAALAPLIAPLISGHSDLAIGTRLSRSSRVLRGHRWAFISRGYSLLLHTLLGAHVSDAQCGFKAIRADIARQLLPHTTDNAWFFDTELLVLAEKCGLRVHEVPVDWVNDADAGVDLVRTALADLRGMGRLGRDLATGRIPAPELRSALDSNSAPGAPAERPSTTAVIRP
jgi:glycosyltransferase involved in cell wall biosynthesis